MNRLTMNDSDSDDELNVRVCHEYGNSRDFGRYFSKLSFNEVFSDVTLVCDGIVYHCHKAVLWTQSEILKSWIEYDQDADTIIVADFDHRKLEKILMILYTGQVV